MTTVQVAPGSKRLMPGQGAVVKLAGVEGAKKLSDELVDTSVEAIANLGPAAKPLRDLAALVRERVR